MTNTQDVRLHSFEAALQALIIDYRAIQQERDQLTEQLTVVASEMRESLNESIERGDKLLRLQQAAQAAAKALEELRNHGAISMDFQVADIAAKALTALEQAEVTL